MYDASLAGDTVHELPTRKFSYADGEDQFNRFDFRVRRLPPYGSKEWKEFNDSFTPSITGPERKAVGLQWHRYRNFCISDKDEFRCRPEDFDKMQNDLERLHLSTAQLPYRTSKIEWTEFHSKNTYLLVGETLLLQCWRASETKSPSHFLFGYGKLFALINDGLAARSFDNVVFFQCPTPFIGFSEDYFHSTWKIIYKSGVEKGWLKSSTRFYTTSQIISNFHLCIKDALVDYSVGLSFGRNDKRSIDHWQRALADFVRSENLSLYRTLVERGRTTQMSKCRQHLQIAVFVRKEGRVGLRLFANLPEVIRLAETFTTRSVQIIKIDSITSVMESIAHMNSYDILITPHGSHLTNALFSLHREIKPSIIEVVATCYNMDFKNNLGERFASYQISSGHAVPDQSLQRSVDLCQRRENCFASHGCPFDVVESAKQSDLQVNLSILQIALDEAASQQCQDK